MTQSDGIDPRPGVIADRLSSVDRIVAVTGSKGGIGKSVVASLYAQSLADRGTAVGLLDLDFTSPTDHIVLGIDDGFPTETYGIDPCQSNGVGVMSVAFLTGDSPTALRGADAGNALLEMLAITRWGDLDTLIFDLPPGLGDTTLDVLRYVPRAEFLLVAGSSRVVISSVRRALRLLVEVAAPVLGVVENMRRGAGEAVADLAMEHSVPFLGAVPFDAQLEHALGDVVRLRTTDAFQAIDRLAL